MKEYNKEIIPLAKALRREMTPWERKLWYTYLCQYPIRFQRQKVLGNYIADFYCAKARLVIELDGGGHYEPEQQVLDAQRTEALKKMGLIVLRFCNLDIDRNFRGVCEKIDKVVQNSLPQSALLTAPSSEGAKSDRTIYALGFFDGVHLGHQALVNACDQLARDSGCQVGVVTFDTHPARFVAHQAPPLINTLKERKRLLAVEHFLVLPFNEELMHMPWQAFLEDLIEKGAAGFVCGDDFRFGYKGQGNAQKLAQFCRERNMPYDVVSEQTIDGVRVSSTYIRSLIEDGNMETAAKFLGHPHILSGTVVQGRQLGRTIGIPTANLLIPKDVVVPRLGVYACTCWMDGKRYMAVTNIGSRPTVDGHQVRAESWLLDFAGDLYGKELTLEFYKFLRPERKFPSLEELRAEILKNGEETRRFFENF